MREANQLPAQFLASVPPSLGTLASTGQSSLPPAPAADWPADTVADCGSTHGGLNPATLRISGVLGFSLALLARREGFRDVGVPVRYGAASHGPAFRALARAIVA